MKLRNEDLLLVPVSFTKILFTVPEKCPNREFFLFCIWTLFTQCKYRFSVNLRKTPLRTDNKSILSVKANNSAINPTKPINSQNHQLKFLTHFCKLPFQHVASNSSPVHLFAISGKQKAILQKRCSEEDVDIAKEKISAIKLQILWAQKGIQNSFKQLRWNTANGMINYFCKMIHLNCLTVF